MEDENISPNEARVYQIQQYHEVLSRTAETASQPLKTLYQLLLTELEVTLQQFTHQAAE
jgi:hypothetical protein